MPLRLFVSVTAFCTLLSVAAPAQETQDVKITAEKIGGNVYMLTGRGGNIGLSVGEDGALLIDDQFAPLADKIRKAVLDITDQPIRFLINTHWHGDHTGGNENFGKGGSIIVAHENVRKRLRSEQFLEAFNSRNPPQPRAALPVVTFEDSVTLHWNDDEIRVLHVKPAHTDGDSVIYFQNSNVVHMGDLYFNGMYPFIDTSTGGNLAGMIAGVERVLALVKDDTKFIPGHGSASGIAEVRKYLEMLKKANAKIGELVKSGKSRDEVIAAKPTESLDADWGGGFLKPDAWVGIVFDGMKK